MTIEVEFGKETRAERTERRTMARYFCFSELRLRCEETGQQIEVRPPDLSPSGMFVSTAVSFPLGAAVNIRMRLADGRRIVRLKGEVRYCLQGVGIGVQFTDVDEATREAVERATRERDW